MRYFFPQKMDHKLDHAATSMFCGGRMTGYLVLFWYLSLRNAYRYSDLSVWGGSFIDEVRLLTAMKQYLKQIKRHFQLYSCSFQLAQVLHLTTERWREQERCTNALLHVFGRRRKQREFIFVSCWSLQCSLTDILDFSLPTSLLHCSTVDQDWCARLCKDTTLHQKEKHCWSAASADTDCSSLSSYLFRFHCKACQSLPGLQTRHWILHLHLHSSLHTLPTTCSASRAMVNYP